MFDYGTHRELTARHLAEGSPSVETLITLATRQSVRDLLTMIVSVPDVRGCAG